MQARENLCVVAYIPLVEVLSEYQGRGVGSPVVLELLERLGSCSMIDLVCDDDVVPFYQRLAGKRINGVVWRDRSGSQSHDH